jgi:TPR repeat protein
MVHLARSYLCENEGNPSSGDRALARTWLAKAVQAGRTEEATTLAALLLDPRAGPVDAQASTAVLIEAAGKGNANAMVELARIAFLGQGMARNTTQAADWTERAASAGRIDAYARLASLYQTDTADGRHPDYANAFLWVQKGVARGDAEAFFGVGTLYEGGLGRPIDFARAEENYQRAADLGSAKAAYQLGLLAEAGHGRPIDLFRAASYFKRAADLGFAPAMIRFGQMAGSGRGMLRDDTAALIAFTKALQLGDPEGYWQAALLTDAGRGSPRNPQRAAGYALEAIVRGNAHALAAVETDLVDLSGDGRRALKQLLVTRGLLAHPSEGDALSAPERDALLAASRSAP